MDIPYYRQETAYTCGAASLRMVLESFGIRRSEKALAKLLRASKVSGVSEKRFPEIVEKFRLDYFVSHEGSFKELVAFFRKGFVLVVCYLDRKENVGHYAVIENVNYRSISLLDPWYGPGYKFSRDDFMKLWKTALENDKRWFIAVKND